MRTLITHEAIWSIFDPLIYSTVEKTQDDDYYIIAELVKKEILSLEMERMESPLDLEFAPPARDTFEHQVKKGIGAYLLKKLGETKVSFEHRRCDVYGHDLKIRIECGHTLGDRLFDSLIKQERDTEFWVIQYYSIPNLGNSNLFKFKYDPNKHQELLDFFHEHAEMKRQYKEKHGCYPEFWSHVFGVIKYPFKDPRDALRNQFE